MKVSIGDLDYYYTEKKVNCFNPDAMKISSYHKQCGDIVTFVENEYDTRRAYDIMYIFKNDKKTPMPPSRFLLDNRHVRWGGKAVKFRIKGKMSDAMLGCRPDYLLYPEHNTREERAEQIRLFNNKAQPLTFIQDGTNTYKNKMVIVTDPYMGFSDNNSIITALKKLQTIKKVSFLEPIGIQKIIAYKEIRDEFLKLNFIPGSKITWTTINLKQADDVFNFIEEFKKVFPRVKAGNIEVDYRDKIKTHGESRENALNDFYQLKSLITKCKNNGYSMSIRMPQDRFETPYFCLFEELSKGTHTHFRGSGLEYLTKRFYLTQDDGMYPNKGNDVFRDLLRQTGTDHELLLHEGKNNYISENDIPGKLGESEFKNGI